MTHTKFLLIGLFIAFMAMGCHSTTTRQKIQNLNGYWSIAKAQPQKGQAKKYKMSPMVDYIKVDSAQKGFRIKLKPQFDGTYKTSKNAEHFTLKSENDTLRFHYKTPLATWNETLLSSDKEHFTVKNEHGDVYTYKRFEGMPKIEDDEK